MSALRRSARIAANYAPYTPTSVARSALAAVGSPALSTAASAASSAINAARAARGVYNAGRHLFGGNEQQNNRTRARSEGARAGNTVIIPSTGYTGKKVKFNKKKLTKRQKAKKKKWKKFKSKVHQVIDKSRPYGYHTVLGATHLYQSTINKWNVQYQSTGTGTDYFTFFQPAQFKDAEAVCFNAKTPAIDSYKTTNVTPTGNFDTNNITHVIDSNVTWKFVNTSQHPTYLEMYICSCKSSTRYASTASMPVAITAKRPDELWTDGATTSLTTRGELASNPVSDLTACLAQAKLMLQSFDVKLVKFKLEPGQIQTHFMQGPKNYRMDGTKKVAVHSTADKTTPTWKNWSSPNCGLIVFFRTLNEMTLGGDAIPSHFPHGTETNKKGGIAASFQMYYKMRAPNTDSTSATDEISNTIVGVNTFQNSLYDRQVDPNNPSDIPNVPA